LKSLGVHVSIDDFGVGYSSLNYLRRLPIDTLKIDQSFVRDIREGRDAPIVTTVISMAQHLGLEVVAEGVETEPQRRFLHDNGCRQMQGFLFSPARPSDECSRIDVAPIVILVGDPGRVARVSARFERVELRAENREFRTHTGWLGGRRISALSTGIGTDNLDIAVIELDALVNLDLARRVPLDTTTSLKLVRLGTSGGLRPEAEVGSIVASRYALGLDGLMPFYDCIHEAGEQELMDALRRDLRWPAEWNPPYVAGASPDLFGALADGLSAGITVTANGFFGPQGRTVRLPLRHPDFNDRLRGFEHGGLRCLNYEMETSALYGLGRALGHEVCTLCAVVANRATQAVSPDAHADVERLIDLALERLVA
jgi:uridine phosphorylase